MARVVVDWFPVFAWMLANPAATLAQAAERHKINPSTLRPAVARERQQPKGGRLAGHPTFGAMRPIVATDAAPTIDPATAAAVYVPLAELRPWARNPKLHDVEAIAASIIRFGFATAITARLADREVIAGHGRISVALDMPRRHAELLTRTRRGPEVKRAIARAALAAWHPEAIALATHPTPVLPVRYRDLSEEEAHALALVDNEAGARAGFDPAALATVMQELEAISLEPWWDPEALAMLANPAASTPSPAANAPPRRRARLPRARPILRQLTLELTDDDAETIRRAVELRRGTLPGTATDLDRAPGVLLATIAREWIAAQPAPALGLAGASMGPTVPGTGV